MRKSCRPPAVSQIGTGVYGAMAILMASSAIMILYHRMGFGDTIGRPHWAEQSVLLPLMGAVAFGALAVLYGRGRRHDVDWPEEDDILHAMVELYTREMVHLNGERLRFGWVGGYENIEFLDDRDLVGSLILETPIDLRNNPGVGDVPVFIFRDGKWFRHANLYPAFDNWSALSLPYSFLIETREGESAEYHFSKIAENIFEIRPQVGTE